MPSTTTATTTRVLGLRRGVIWVPEHQLPRRDRPQGAQSPRRLQPHCHPGLATAVPTAAAQLEQRGHQDPSELPPRGAFPRPAQGGRGVQGRRRGRSARDRGGRAAGEGGQRGEAGDEGLQRHEFRYLPRHAPFPAPARQRGRAPPRLPEQGPGGPGALVVVGAPPPRVPFHGRGADQGLPRLLQALQLLGPKHAANGERGVGREGREGVEAREPGLEEGALVDGQTVWLKEVEVGISGMM
jgi:hypothetical protein